VAIKLTDLLRASGEKTDGDPRALQVARVLLAGHANITTTQRYMNARANSLAESMRHARERRVNRLARYDEEQVEVG